MTKTTKIATSTVLRNQVAALSAVAEAATNSEGDDNWAAKWTAEMADKIGDLLVKYEIDQMVEACPHCWEHETECACGYADEKRVEDEARNERACDIHGNEDCSASSCVPWERDESPEFCEECGEVIEDGEPMFVGQAESGSAPGDIHNACWHKRCQPKGVRRDALELVNDKPRCEICGNTDRESKVYDGLRACSQCAAYNGWHYHGGNRQHDMVRSLNAAIELVVTSEHPDDDGMVFPVRTQVVDNAFFWLLRDMRAGLEKDVWVATFWEPADTVCARLADEEDLTELNSGEWSWPL